MATKTAIPSISEWSTYGGKTKYSYDLSISRNKIGYKFMITPNYSSQDKFLGSYSLMVFIGDGNKPSEVGEDYGYKRLGSHKTPQSACKQAKEYFKDII